MLHLSNDVFGNGVEYPCIEIDTPFLTSKDPKARDQNESQALFQSAVDDFLTNISKKSLVLRSRYGSGTTTFTQRLTQEQSPAKVLFITYRQTSARGIMRYFRHLGCKNYLDSYDDPTVWESPREQDSNDGRRCIELNFECCQLLWTDGLYHEQEQ